LSAENSRDASNRRDANNGEKNQEQKGCQQLQDLSNSRMSKINSMDAKLIRKVP
jgi:hypothetical protein